MYPGNDFYLVDDDQFTRVEPGKLTTIHGCPSSAWGLLPFPLSKKGMITVAEDAAYDSVRDEAFVPFSYKVFVARSDEKLEEVSEQHFVRVYAPQEMRQAAKNFERYFTEHDCQPMKHSRCQTWGSTEITIEVPATFMSPFADAADAIDFKKRIRKNISSSSDDLPGKDMDCMRLVIAAMRELVNELHDEIGKRHYTDGELIEKLQEIMPQKNYRGMGEDSLKRSFASATSARNFERDKLRAVRTEN
jgi:hypothetical protein